MTDEAPPPAGSVMIPADFWRSVSPDEMLVIVQRGGLDRGQCIRVFEMLGRTDEPPAFLELIVRRADVERIWPRKPAP
jgi:hypothetical protein